MGRTRAERWTDRRAGEATGGFAARSRVPHKHFCLARARLRAADAGADYLAMLMAQGSEDEAILASAVFIRAQSLVPQALLLEYQRAERPDLPTTCEGQYDDADLAGCTALWRGMFAGISNYSTDLPRPALAGVTATEGGEYGGEGGFDLLLDQLAGHVANVTCPCCSLFARMHSEPSVNETRGADRLQRLRRLDANFLNGSIAQLERETGCAVSTRYKSAEPARA